MARKSREADTIRDLRVQIANDKASKKTKKTAGEDVVVLGASWYGWVWAG